MAGASIPSPIEDINSKKDGEGEEEEGRKEWGDVIALEKWTEEGISEPVEVALISVVHPSTKDTAVDQDVEAELTLDDLTI